MSSTEKKPLKCQDLFLAQMRDAKKGLSIFLVNGIKLQGTIIAFDNETILLNNQELTQMVYKTAISTICPGR